MKTITDKRALGVRVSPKLIKSLKMIAIENDMTLEQLITPELESLIAKFKAVK